MANFFRNKVIKNVGTELSEVVRIPNNSRATVIGLSMANLTENPILVSVHVEDHEETLGFYIKEVIVAAHTTLKVLNGGEKLILAPDNALFVSASQDNCVDVVLSYVEIV